MKLYGDATKKLPRLTIYKPNANNTGSVLSLEIRPACGDRKGHLKLIIAPQSAAGKYEWGMRNECNLSVLDVFLVVPVLKGDAEACTARIKTFAEDNNRFVTEVARNSLGECTISVGFVSSEGGFEGWNEIRLSRHEARGVASVIESSLARIAFGD